MKLGSVFNQTNYLVNNSGQLAIEYATSESTVLCTSTADDGLYLKKTTKINLYNFTVLAADLLSLRTIPGGISTAN